MLCQAKKKEERKKDTLSLKDFCINKQVSQTSVAVDSSTESVPKQNNDSMCLLHGTRQRVVPAPCAPELLVPLECFLSLAWVCSGHTFLSPWFSEAGSPELGLRRRTCPAHSVAWRAFLSPSVFCKMLLPSTYSKSSVIIC